MQDGEQLLLLGGLKLNYMSSFAPKVLHHPGLTFVPMLGGYLSRLSSFFSLL